MRKLIATILTSLILLVGCDTQPLTVNDMLDYQISNPGKQYQVVNITNISNESVIVSEMVMDNELGLPLWMQCDFLEGQEFFERIEPNHPFEIDFVLEPGEDYTCLTQFAWSGESTITNIEFR